MGAVLDLLFPPRCCACGVPDTLLCDACRAGLRPIDPARACPRCGAPIVRRACPECRGRAYAFEATRAVGLFAPPLSNLVVTFKDGPERRLASELGGLLAATAIGLTDVAIVPVPATAAAVRRRGFDHMRVLAGALGRRIGTPVAPCLAAGRSADQRELSRDERARNVSGVFGLQAPPPREVLLLDDVFTTGATLDAAAQVLLQGGAEHVTTLVVARVVNPMTPVPADA
ncbi:MAG: ComF family protein [Anaerosomatales bacterium]|nr:ComF family protein [Anaerosomatales bacterium]